MLELYQLGLYYISAVWKRRWIALTVACIISVVGWAIVIMIPDSYQSRARIYVDSSNVLQPLLRGITVDNNIVAQVRLMKQTLLSDPNIEAVARKTDYDLTATTDAESRLLLQDIRDRTRISATEEDIFSITYTDSEAARAQNVVLALIDIFVESNIGESRQELDIAQDFIEQQVDIYERQLQQAENQLAAFKQDNMELLAGEGGYVGRASVTKERLRLIKQELQQAIAERNVLRRELASVPESIPFGDAASLGPPSDTSVRLLDAEARLRSLLARYTEKHPDVVSTKREVEKILAKAEAEANALAEFAVQDGEQSGGQPNPLYADLKLRLIEQESRVASLRQRVADVGEEFDEINQIADRVPIVEARLKQLNRDYDVIKRKHSELLSRRESARLSREREQRGDEVVYRLVEPPRVPIHPSGPNRPLLMSGALGLGLTAGIAFALALVLLDTSFWSVRDLQGRINLPVYGSISSSGSTTERVGSTLNNLSLGLAVLCLIGLFGALLAIERQFGLGTLSLERLTPSLLVDSLEALRQSLFGVSS